MKLSPEQTIERVRALSSGLLSKEPAVKLARPAQCEVERIVVVPITIIQSKPDRHSPNARFKEVLRMQGTFVVSDVPGGGHHSACARLLAKGMLRITDKLNTTGHPFRYRVTEAGKLWLAEHGG